MRTVSYIIASFHRPRLLAYTLQNIMASKLPSGWQLEVVVAITDRQGIRVERDGQIVWRGQLGDGSDVGAQNDRALLHSTGDIILLSGDDDLQSPLRAAESIQLIEGGAPMCGSNRFYFVRVSDGRVCEWKGPAHRAGSTMAYRRHLLIDAGGWGSCEKNGDFHLHQNLHAAGYRNDSVALLPAAVGLSSAFLSHSANISGNRPFPHAKQRYGSFMLFPAVDHWSELEWPEHTRFALSQIVGTDITTNPYGQNS